MLKKKKHPILLNIVQEWRCLFYLRLLKGLLDGGTRSACRACCQGCRVGAISWAYVRCAGRREARAGERGRRVGPIDRCFRLLISPCRFTMLALKLFYLPLTLNFRLLTNYSKCRSPLMSNNVNSSLDFADIQID